VRLAAKGSKAAANKKAPPQIAPAQSTVQARAGLKPKPAAAAAKAKKTPAKKKS